MTQEQWGIFVTGVLVGVAFCGCAVLGAAWMFKTVMKLNAAGFNILTWRDNQAAPEPQHKDVPND